MLGVASTKTIVGSGGIPTSCSIVGLPGGLTATVAGNGCAISGTATAPLAQSSYTLSASNDDGTTTITIEIQIPVDRDANGLIELYTLTQLHNMRYSLDGSRYKTSSTDTGITAGCPNDACIGYELMNDLDFDTDGDGQTWSQDGAGNYSLDSGDSAAPYFVIDSSGSGGWQPIGNSVSNAFNAIFDGNGYVIRNLAIRRELTYIGLFGFTAANAIIRNVGLVNNLSDYTGSSNSTVYIGGLVGRQRGSITGSYATGDADGGAGYNDSVGGLVGFQNGGSITGSYATGNADGGDGNFDYAGGLVGSQGSGGSITASYATGNADGGAGNQDRVGGLVGDHSGSITASYATGNVDGSAGDNDFVGGLVGRQTSGGSITASYATSNADGGAGDRDRVGGLVGDHSGSITASYATGNADGGDGRVDYVGGLVGRQTSGGSITASYATGDADGGDGIFDYVGGLVGWQDRGSITASYATGNADGGAGGNDRVGGLVGNHSGSITASYATGNADGGDGDGDLVGGLVGFQFIVSIASIQFSGSITGSYATGDADGGDGADTVGGLVGWQQNGNIVASYATGNADGGAGASDEVGGLVGLITGGGITASYSFGSAIGETAGSDGTPRPTGVTSAADLTAANVGSSWNSASSSTLGAWDFGGGAQPPALVFNDYDGFSTGTDYAALLTLTALIPNQRPASSPQIGTATTDIQLNDGDTANSISGNIDLPATFNGENLTWSVFYDPAPTVSQVSVDNTNSVQVNAAHRSTARTFILRAVDSNSNIVNDYHLRIIE